MQFPPWSRACIAAGLGLEQKVPPLAHRWRPRARCTLKVHSHLDDSVLRGYKRRPVAPPLTSRCHRELEGVVTGVDGNPTLMIAAHIDAGKRSLSEFGVDEVTGGDFERMTFVPILSAPVLVIADPFFLHYRCRWR